MFVVLYLNVNHVTFALPILFLQLLLESKNDMKVVIIDNPRDYLVIPIYFLWFRSNNNRWNRYGNMVTVAGVTWLQNSDAFEYLIDSINYQREFFNIDDNVNFLPKNLLSKNHKWINKM